MRPILFSLGDFHLVSYGVCVTLGYAAGVGYLWFQRARMGFSRAELWDLVLVLIAAALIGGRLGSLFFYGPPTWAEALEKLVRLGGGFSFYHGFWAGALAGYLCCRIAGKDPAAVGDFCAAAMALGHVPGRLGCFLAGCCFGRPTSLPWGVTFPAGQGVIPKALEGALLHPTQLYEAAGNLVLAACLHLAIVKGTLRGRLKPGAVFWFYVLAYALLRFATDPLRGEDPGRLAGRLTTGQWDAVFSMVLAAAGLSAMRLRAGVASRSPGV